MLLNSTEPNKSVAQEKMCKKVIGFFSSKANPVLNSEEKLPVNPSRLTLGQV